MNTVECENHGVETYKSFGGWMCCSTCFNEVKKEEPKKIDKEYHLRETSDDYRIVKEGKIIESFNKVAEDYAYTLCQSALRRYRNYQSKESN